VRTRSLATGLALLVALLVSGCDIGKVENPPTAQPEKPRILTNNDLLRSLITAEMIGDKFTDYRSTPDLTVIGPGCLQAFDAVTRTSFPVREQVAYIRPEKKPLVPSIVSIAATFASVGDAETALPGMRKEIDPCTKVSQVEDGTRFTLAVTHDNDRFGDSVDDQLNVFAHGTVTTKNGVGSMVVGFSAIRVGSNVVVTGFITSSDAESVDKEMATLNRAAVDRLRAVVDSKPVPNDLLPGFNRLAGGSDPSDT